MSSYDDYWLNRAAEKVKRYNEKLTDEEYSAVMKRALCRDESGKLACNILATAREQNWSPLDNVSSWRRDHYKEASLADHGSSLINSGGCFITTACLKHFRDHFDDDCYELTELRYLRDTFVKIQHPSDVEEYYRIGPVIVEAINAHENCDEIYADIYENLVLATIRLSETSYEAAYLHYKDYVANLKNLYCKEVTK